MCNKVWRWYGVRSGVRAELQRMPHKTPVEGGYRRRLCYSLHPRVTLTIRWLHGTVFVLFEFEHAWGSDILLSNNLPAFSFRCTVLGSTSTTVPYCACRGMWEKAIEVGVHVVRASQVLQQSFDVGFTERVHRMWRNNTRKRAQT